MSLSINHKDHDEAYIVALVGEIDIATVEQLDEAVADAIDSAKPIAVVDLTAVSFMDSTGLRSVMTAHSALTERERRFVVVVDSGPVARLLDITGVAGTLEIRDSLAFLDDDH